MTRLFRFVAVPSCLALLALGCSRKTPTPPAAHSDAADPPASTLNTAALFAGDTDLHACRNAVQQLNNQLARHPEQKSAPRSEAECALLRDDFGLDLRELEEVNRPTFTTLDAHHLELCFLLRDVVRSLDLAGLPPRERAAAGFAWVMRQVQLRTTNGPPCPPSFVLRRGWGSAVERALVFIALLRQMGLDGCAIVAPRQGPGPAPPFVWAVGALGGRTIWLFDPRRGLALPGPVGQPIITLAFVLAEADLPPMLAQDWQTGQSLSGRQVKRSEIHLACSLSELAPRMRYLQRLLPATEGVCLEVHPLELLDRFRAAMRGSPPAQCPVRVWGRPGDSYSPIRLLRSFLPPEEGGIDTTGRKYQAEETLVPWKYLPRAVHDLPEDLGPGNRLKDLFGRAFVSFALDARMPRDLLLRGQLDEATSKLIDLQDQLRQQQQLARQEKDLEARTAAWCQRLEAAHAGAVQAERQALRQPTTEAAARLQEARAQVQACWQDRQPAVLLVQSAAVEPLNAEAAYLLALSQHEKAERVQAIQDRTRPAQPLALLAALPHDLPWAAVAFRAQKGGGPWPAVLERWQTFLDNYPAVPSAASARRLRARALRLTQADERNESVHPQRSPHGR